ncbi:FAD-dependent monooxygenase [Cysteiniphilum halobium]|uniref:FAD-dependent monooxygenase n=1 Tax=Cysteiniphilum halobium TaxID=2219059 RepID=UPI003F87DD56
MNKTNVIISGAGISGLCAAIFLLSHGIDVSIYEESSSLRSEGGCIQIPESILFYLDQLELSYEFKKTALRCNNIKTQHKKMINRDIEQMMIFKGIKEYIQEENIYTISRGDLYEILLKKLRSLKAKCIFLSSSVKEFKELQSNINVLINDQIFMANYVLGADGVRSNLRKQITFQNPSVKFINYGIWRSKIKVIDELYDAQADLYSDGVNWIYTIPYVQKSQVYIELLGILKTKNFNTYAEKTGDVKQMIKDFEGFDSHVLSILNNINEKCYYYDMLLKTEPVILGTNRCILLGDAAKSYPDFIGFGSAQAIKQTIVTLSSIFHLPLKTNISKVYTHRKPFCGV